MFVVDSSVWINHFRLSDESLVSALSNNLVATHPFVIGELALGSLSDRGSTINLLQDLPQAVVAEDNEVLGMIESRSLFSRGLGYVDAHLLASVLISRSHILWTADKRLNAVANELGVAGSHIN